MTSILLSLIDSGSYFTYNKHIAKSLGIYGAIIMGFLAFRYNRQAERGQLRSFEEGSDKGYFSCSQEEIEDNTCLSRKQQYDTLRNLEKAGLIETVRKGQPAVNYYHIQEDALLEVLNRQKESDINHTKCLDLMCPQAHLDVPTGTSIYNNTVSSKPTANKVSSKPYSASPRMVFQKPIPTVVGDGETDASSDAEDKNASALKEDVLFPEAVPDPSLEALDRIFREGGFPHRIGKPSKVVSASREMLEEIKGGRILSRAYDSAWAERFNIDMKALHSRLDSIRTLPEAEGLLMEAVHNLSLMRREDYWPPSKSGLDMTFPDFMHNPRMLTSWFLYCLCNEPRKLNKATVDGMTDKMMEELPAYIVNAWDELGLSDIYGDTVLLACRRQIEALNEWHGKARSDEFIAEAKDLSGSTYRRKEFWKSYFSFVTDRLSGPEGFKPYLFTPLGAYHLDWMAEELSHHGGCLDWLAATRNTGYVKLS